MGVLRGVVRRGGIQKARGRSSPRPWLRRVVSRYAQSRAVSDNVSALPTGWASSSHGRGQISLRRRTATAPEPAPAAVREVRPPSARTVPRKAFCTSGTTTIGTATTAASPAVVDRKTPAASTPAQAQPTTSPTQLALSESQSAGTARQFPSVDEVEHFEVAAEREDGEQQRRWPRRRRVSLPEVPAGGGRCRGPRPARGAGTRLRRRRRPAGPRPGRRAAAGVPRGQAASRRAWGV